MMEKTSLVADVLLARVPTLLQKTGPPVVPGIVNTLLHSFESISSTVEEVLSLTGMELKFSVLENWISKLLKDSVASQVKVGRE